MKLFTHKDELINVKKGDLVERTKGVWIEVKHFDGTKVKGNIILYKTAPDNYIDYLQEMFIKTHNHGWKRLIDIAADSMRTEEKSEYTYIV